MSSVLLQTDNVCKRLVFVLWIHRKLIMMTSGYEKAEWWLWLGSSFWPTLNAPLSGLDNFRQPWCKRYHKHCRGRCACALQVSEATGGNVTDWKKKKWFSSGQPRIKIGQARRFGFVFLLICRLECDPTRPNFKDRLGEQKTKPPVQSNSLHGELCGTVKGERYYLNQLSD